VLEIDERAIWPKPLPQLLACHEVAGSCQQQRQNLERLSRKVEANACLPQLTRVEIQFENAELDKAKRRR
jgi:hypothetical protein